MNHGKFISLGSLPYEEVSKIELPSVTGVTKFATCASEYEYVNMPSIEDSTAIILGGLFDAIVTQKGVSDYVVVDVETGPTSKAYKKAADEIKASGKKPITQDVMDKAQKMADSFMSHPFVKSALCPINDIVYQNAFKCDTHKGIADVYDKTDKIVYEIKTSSNPQKFKWAAEDLGYKMQLAAYMRAFDAIEGYWLVIDSNPPHEVYPIKIKEETYYLALKQFDDSLVRFGKINKNNPQRASVAYL